MTKSSTVVEWKTFDPDDEETHPPSGKNGYKEYLVAAIEIIDNIAFYKIGVDTWDQVEWCYFPFEEDQTSIQFWAELPDHPSLITNRQ